MAPLVKKKPTGDVVAGRTASQIERAKRKAVGGKRKRCVKGKSCSATCIAANKVCMVDIPWVAAKGIPAVVAQIQGKQTAKANKISPSIEDIAKDVYKKEWTKAWKAMNLAIANDDKQSYNLYKDNITKYYNKLTDKGIKLGPLKIPEWSPPKPITVRPTPKPTPKVEASAKPPVADKIGSGKGFNLAKGQAPKLPELKTSKDIVNALYSPIEGLNAHKNVKDLLEGNDEANSFARKYLTKLVGGAAALKRGLDALRSFTGTTYIEMREAQRKAKKGETLSTYYSEKLKRANDLEKLVAKLPKDPVIKYRGIRVEKNHLDGMIAMAKKKGSFTEGALASWSTGLETPLSFAAAVDYVKTQSVILRTVNRRGAAVKHLSAFFNEDEVLTSGTAKYKYTGNYNVIEHEGRIYHVFDLVES